MKKAYISVLVIILALCTVVTANASTIFHSGSFSYSLVTSTTASLYGWDNDSDTLTVPNSIDDYYIVSITDSAFKDNTYIHTLNLSNASMLKEIGFFTFQNCTNMSGALTIPSQVNQIGYSAFQGCSSLNKVNFLCKNLTVIPDQCFYNCSSLENVTLSDKISTINKLAFANCAALKYITIPESVNSIDDSAFNGCENLIFLCKTGSYAAQYAQAKNIRYITTDDHLMGDVNGDNRVNIRDVTYIQLFGVDRYELTGYVAEYLADTNKDGAVTIRDATTIQLYLVGKINIL